MIPGRRISSRESTRPWRTTSASRDLSRSLARSPLSLFAATLPYSAARQWGRRRAAWSPPHRSRARSPGGRQSPRIRWPGYFANFLRLPLRQLLRPFSFPSSFPRERTWRLRNGLAPSPRFLLPPPSSSTSSASFRCRCPSTHSRDVPTPGRPYHWPLTDYPPRTTYSLSFSRGRTRRFEVMNPTAASTRPTAAHLE